MKARGPDDAGTWKSPNGALLLGHRRLAILDLSPAGHQPMLSACRRYVVSFNGEIYNYRELRRDLQAKGCVFRTNADTEALLHLYAMEGEEMTRRLRGMFAFAIWDDENRKLFLARDTFGIKPLYYSDDLSTFRFASQVKALMGGGAISTELCAAGAAGFFLWGSVPDPFTLYRRVRALPAGHSLVVSAKGAEAPRQYCSVASLYSGERATPTAQPISQQRIRDAALESVSAHLQADVDVGVFLSAGVDSGAMLGLMHDAGKSNIKAITLGFEEFRGTSEDEAPLAKLVADQYGAEHFVRMVSQEELEQDLPAIFAAMDQPSIDGVNIWFVAKSAKEAGIKVALSGLGGDELFGGYPSFKDIPHWVNALRIPSAIPGLGRATRFLSTSAGLATRSPKATSLLEFGGSYGGAYLLRRGLFMPHEIPAFIEDRRAIEQGLEELATFSRLRIALETAPDNAFAKVSVLESANYMRNQLLRDADWAGMAHSVEIRTPLVDTRLTQTLAPLCSTLAPGEGKRALANAPSVPLPAAIVERAKTGFVVPTHAWGLSATARTRNAAGPSKGAVSRAWAKTVFGAFHKAA